MGVSVLTCASFQGTGKAEMREFHQVLARTYLGVGIYSFHLTPSADDRNGVPYGGKISFIRKRRSVRCQKAHENIKNMNNMNGHLDFPFICLPLSSLLYGQFCPVRGLGANRSLYHMMAWLLRPTAESSSPKCVR